MEPDIRAEAESDLQHRGAVQLYALGEVHGLIPEALLPDGQRLIDGGSICVLVAQDVQPGQDIQMSHLYGARPVLSHVCHTSATSSVFRVTCDGDLPGALRLLISVSHCSQQDKVVLHSRLPGGGA